MVTVVVIPGAGLGSTSLKVQYKFHGPERVVALTLCELITHTGWPRLSWNVEWATPHSWIHLHLCIY